MSTTTSDVEDASGRVSVSRLRQTWAVQEDSALAQRLQSQEITSHLSGNRQRNLQIREVDVPIARHEQSLETAQARQEAEERRLRMREVEERDQAVARQLEEDVHRRYEAQRDEAFARRIQRMELETAIKSREGLPQRPAVNTNSSSSSSDAGSGSNTVLRRPEPEGTPPLPVGANGDVPGPQSFHDLRGGIRYNEREYLVEMARPALVTTEPVYANNRPEHYAVGNAYGASGGGDLLGAAGLSQKDLALSRKAEELLDQERRDQQLARRLQEAMTSEITAVEDGKDEREAQDLELAKQLHAKEKAKLKRAKERSRLKKLEQQQLLMQQNQEQEVSLEPATEESPPHARTDSRLSRQSNHSNESSHIPQLQHRHGIEPVQQLHHRQTSEPPQQQNQLLQQQVLLTAQQPHSPPGALPARRPYINRDHMNDSFVDGAGASLVDGIEAEPMYENVPAMQAAQLHYRQHSQMSEGAGALLPPGYQFDDEDDNMPVPPYMPMQQSSSRKSSSLEKKILKKKEKEGCKQQ